MPLILTNKGPQGVTTNQKELSQMQEPVQCKEDLPSDEKNNRTGGN